MLFKKGFSKLFGDYRLYLLLVSIFISLDISAQISFRDSDSWINYTGRVLKTKDSTVFYWPGTSAIIRYKGLRFKVTMKSLRKRGYFI